LVSQFRAPAAAGRVARILASEDLSYIAIAAFRARNVPMSGVPEAGSALAAPFDNSSFFVHTLVVTTTKENEAA
jgi:hypothetical protein